MILSFMQHGWGVLKLLVYFDLALSTGGQSSAAPLAGLPLNLNTKFTGQQNEVGNSRY